MLKNETINDTESKISTDVSSEENEQIDIEKDAKQYFNDTHSKSIEEQILSIHENAMNSYAKEDTEETESAADETVESVSDTQSDEAVPEASDADSSKTKDYDMSQLLTLLKGSEGKSDEFDDEYDDEEPKKKNKKNKKKDDFSEETESDTVYSEIYEDNNEYPHDFEYTDKAQGLYLFKDLRKSAVIASVASVLTLLFTLLCLWIEQGHAAGLPFENAMRAGRYGRVYIMVSLQMLAFCVFFNLDGLARGIRRMNLKHAAPEAVPVAITAVCTLQALYSAICAYESLSLKTYCFFGCAALFVLSLNTFVKAYTRFKAFAIVLSKKDKLITKNVEGISAESSAFAKYLTEDSEILTVAKTESVSDFIKNTYTVPKSVKACNLMMYTVLAVSLVAAILSMVLLKTPIYDALTSAVFVFLLSSPISYLITTALPYFIAFTKAGKLHAAFLGEATTDLYDNADVISFDDTEVFPPKAVKVTSINTYNSHRIDKVLVYMSKIFDKLGGPLSYIFSSSVQGSLQEDAEIMVIETSDDGLHLKVGEDDILLGTGNYLRMYDIETPADSIDETEIRSLTSILWLVCNNELAAKFYIRYNMNKNFEKILKGLYDAGICCGIRTLDPSINNQLITGNLKGANYPISVIKKDIKDIGKIEEAVSGGIISLSGIHNFLKSFIMLDKLRGVYKSNSVLAVLGSVIGLAVSVCLAFALVSTSPMLVLWFQLLWLIPPVLVSVFSK